MTIKDWWIDFGSQYPRNTTVHWCDSDYENNPKRKVDYPYHITYKFNGLGFRSCELETISDKVNILVSGCSHTVGIGVPLEMSWCHCLGQMIPDSVVHNVAIGGASPDYVARSIYIALQHIKPNLIFILWPDSSRIEYYRKDAVFNIQTHSEDYPRIFVDDVQHFNNLKKNRLLVDCLTKGIPTYHGTIRLANSEGVGLARDGAHGCDRWHRNLAQNFYFKYQHSDLENKLNSFDDILDYKKNVQSTI